MERLLDILTDLHQKEPASTNKVLHRGVQQVLPDPESLAREMESRRITIYLGIDPTSPHLHIGHSVPLRKLAQFQELGHDVKLLFGTFTAMIGDPTDKSAARIKLTADQVRQNMETYVQQAGKVLDLGPNAQNPITLEKNGKWLEPLNFADVVELAAEMTVGQLLQRSMFKTRMETNKPIGVHELLYPLMQGYDSVAMDVDVEVGGTDQTFNMLVGRDLVRSMLNKEKWVVPTKLIKDPNGQKMGKTTGNIVALSDLPAVKYEAAMTWPDSAIPLGFELLTNAVMSDVREAQEAVGRGELDPRDLKSAFSRRMIAELDGIQAAADGEAEFARVYTHGGLPANIKDVVIARGTRMAQALVVSGLASTESQANQLIGSRAVYLNGEQVRANTKPQNNSLISVGKRTIGRIRRVIMKE